MKKIMEMFGNQILPFIRLKEKRRFFAFSSLRFSVLLSSVSLAFMLISCLDERIETPPLTIEMHKGYTFQLSAASENVEWESANPSVATVSQTGLITAKSAGKTVISCSSKKQKDVACYLEVYPRRNLLFYIATGDASIIDGDTQEKIDLIRSGWKSGMGEMIIYADRRVKGASLFRINGVKDSRGMYGLDTLQVYGNENSADPSKITRAVNYMTTNYPADSYGMIFFAHGSGWLPQGTWSTPRSLVIDDVNGSNKEIEFYDFVAAIPEKTLDFIIFEECLMADVAFLYELRNKTNYVLASSAEIVSPGFTYIYQEQIENLYSTKEETGKILSGFGQSYIDIIRKKFPENSEYCSATMSLIKLSEMNALASATKNALNGKDIKDTVNMSEIQYFDRVSSSRTRFFDLGNAVKVIATPDAFNAFNAQLNKTVIWKDATAHFLGIKVNYHSGLTTYIKRAAFPYLNSEYEKTAWYGAIR